MIAPIKLVCWDQRMNGGHGFPCPEVDCDADETECCPHCLWEEAE